MHKKYITGFFALILLSTTGLLLASKPKPAKKEVPAAPACCKAVDRSCTPAPKPVAPASTLDQLSQQFISIPVFIR